VTGLADSNPSSRPIRTPGSNWDATSTAIVCSDIRDERWRQECKIQTGKIPWDCADPNVDHDRKLAVLVEEVGEVGRALIEGDGLRAELVQVAAVAVAWIESLDAA
jgi:NTP pyrophosphatase (non-canonical NTP hydrolase)